MPRGQPHAGIGRERTKYAGEQDGSCGLVCVEEIPATLVALEDLQRDARALNASISSPGFGGRVRAPVLVGDPCRGSEMVTWNNEATWSFVDSSRDGDEDEVLAFLNCRCLRLEAKWPADALELGTASGLHLNLDHAARGAVDLHREDVRTLESIACERRGPSAARKLRGDIVLADCLGLLRIHHVPIVISIAQ